jgi:uncharacterized protein YacL
MIDGEQMLVGKDSNMRRTLTRLLDGLSLLVAIALIIVGLAIIVGPKYPEGPIHIRLVPGHAITTQDVVALVPILLGAFIIASMLWRQRRRFLRYLDTKPRQAVGRLMLLGVLIGILIGLLLGVIYERPILQTLRTISAPIDALFESLGLI